MKRLLIISSLLIGITPLAAQNLTFTLPGPLVAGASTDKAVDITNFNGSYFLTWKSAGKNTSIHYSYLGKRYDTAATHHEASIPDEKTSSAPVLRVTNGRIYLFWISPDGDLKYIINRTDTSFDTGQTYTLSFPGHPKLAHGITTAAIGNRVVFASHAADNRHLVYAVATPGANGVFSDVTLKTMEENSTSTDYPFVVAVSDTSARFCWKGYRDQDIYYADLSIGTGKWTPPSRLGSSRSAVSPALYRVWRSARLFYIWRGPDKEDRLYYLTDSASPGPAQQNELPGYFTTRYPVSICHMDDNNFLLAYTGEDGRIYASKFANYKPSTWMQDILMPAKSNYTLKDIVIPGSHDAGMSVLNGVGGTQSGTINECNTLTQRKNIDAQLKAGIRMFDLRVGSYKNAFFAKHSSSDCMADAIGGGYGESLDTIVHSVRRFLLTNRGEIVLLTFSHLCERETPVNELAENILKGLGEDIVYIHNSASLSTLPLKELAGKAIVTFEHYSRPDHRIDSCTIDSRSDAFINFRREYAATNDMEKFLLHEEQFFRSLSGGVRDNDLIRLDWQLTQSGDEAAMICNDFQDEKVNPLVNGVMMLTGALRRHKSIIDLSLTGNKYLPVTVNDWMGKGIITPANKPNILYVDVAGEWITDYCLLLNQTRLYTKP